MAASVAYGRIAGKGYKLAVVSEAHVPPGHVVSPRTQRAPGNGANQAGSFHTRSCFSQAIRRGKPPVFAIFCNNGGFLTIPVMRIVWDCR